MYNAMGTLFKKNVQITRNPTVSILRNIVIAVHIDRPTHILP